MVCELYFKTFIKILILKKKTVDRFFYMIVKYLMFQIICWYYFYKNYDEPYVCNFVMRNSTKM